MATNVSERIHTLQDILDALQEQANDATEDIDPRVDDEAAFYCAGQLMAIAKTSATVSAMIADLWATNTGGGS